MSDMRSRSIAYNRDDGGRLVREIWIGWALRHPHPKQSWLTEWDELDERSKEADRYIWDEVVAPYNAMIVDLVNENTRYRTTVDRLLKRIEELEQQQEGEQNT